MPLHLSQVSPIFLYLSIALGICCCYVAYLFNSIACLLSPFDVPFLYPMQPIIYYIQQLALRLVSQLGLDSGLWSLWESSRIHYITTATGMVQSKRPREPTTTRLCRVASSLTYEWLYSYFTLVASSIAKHHWGDTRISSLVHSAVVSFEPIWTNLLT